MHLGSVNTQIIWVSARRQIPSMCFLHTIELCCWFGYTSCSQAIHNRENKQLITYTALCSERKQHNICHTTLSPREHICLRPLLLASKLIQQWMLWRYILTYFLITYLPHSSTFWGWDPDPDPDPCSTFIRIHEYFAFSLYRDTPCRFWVLTPKRLTSALRNLSSSLGRLYCRYSHFVAGTSDTYLYISSAFTHTCRTSETFTLQNLLFARTKRLP